MAALIDYTSYAEVRGMLGITEKEIPDSTLSLDYYLSMLAMDLDLIGPSINSEFQSILTIQNPTDEQIKFKTAVKTYATVTVAQLSIPALRLAVPKDITDGKAALTRFSDKPFEELRKDLDDVAQQIRQVVQSTYNTLISTPNLASTITLLVVSSPTDPVTGV